MGAITASTSKTLEITATVKPTGTYTFPGSITGGQSDPTAGNNTTSTTTTPTPITDLTLGVAVDEEEPDVGSNVTFTITATNNGPSNATGVNVSAILPAGYTLISQTGGTNYIPGTGAWSVGDLAASTNKTLEITASVNPSGPYAFNGTIAGSQTDLITDNNDASTTTTPQPITDLALNMAVDNPTPDVGSNVTFSLTATNNGPSNATGVTVTAALPAGYTYVSHTAGMTYSSGSWTVGNLAAGTNKTLEITATVNPTGSYTFNGTIEGGQTDLTTGNNSTSTTTNSTDITDLVIDVTVDNATPNVGSHVVFTLTATNNGPSDASGVNVTAALPAGYTYVSHTSGIAYISGTWTVGNLTAGTSKELKITATVNPPANYLFNASISGNQSDLSTGNNSDQISITPQQSDLIINMSASESDPLVGETVTFTLSATNEGPNNATNVLVTDQLPSGFTHTGSTPSKGSYNASSGIWTIGALAVNETVTLQISSSVKAPETGNNYLNKASITGDQYDPDTSNNEAKVLADPQQSDLSIIVTADQSDYYVDNQPVFTITIDNEGPDEASGLAINAVVPAGYSDISDISSGGVLSSGTISWSNKNLNNGASLSLTFKATIDPPQQAANEYQVAAFIAAFDQFDPVESDNSASLTPNILNTPPVANANDATTDEDTPLNVNAANGVLSNDTDIDGDPLTVTQFRVNSMTRPAGTELTFTQGKLTIHPNGSFTYTPALNFNGAVPEISYTVSDGTTTSTGILGITVNAVNDSPVVTDDYVYTAEGTPVNYSILANDNDLADGSAGGLDGNTLKITQEPSNGTLTILQNNQIIYSPHTGFYGNDEAEYEICDLGYPGSLCRSAKIFFSVARRSPIANDDTAETDEDEAVQIDILSNDDDTDIDPTTVEIIVKPKYGTANYLGNGMVEYMPDQDFNGTDFFTYTVTDRTNLTSNEARVDITIHPVDDAPVATDGLYSTRENQPVVIPMSERVSDADNNIDWNSIAIVAQPANGQVTTGPGTGEVSYTPDNHFFGTDEFQFTLSDLTSLTSNVATISIQVSDQAPTAADDVASTNEDEAVIIHVLDNDTDPQNDINTASVAISQAPQNGSASPNEDGTVTYTPNPDYFGEDSFFYKVCDDIDYCDEARVTITIDPVNDAPVAVDDEVTLPEDTSVLIRALNNDFDVDNANGELTLTIVTQPLNGAAQLVSEPIGIQYTPNENYFGTDQIIYRITDPDGLWDEATINLSITWVNDTPLSANDQYGPISLAGATLDVLANDSDPDDNLDPSSLSIYEAPKNGTATPNPDGTIYYLPNEDFFGNDSFLYQICDEEGACAQAQVSLSVIAGNGPPQANNDEYTLSEDEPYLFNPIGNDQDPNNNIDPSTSKLFRPPKTGHWNLWVMMEVCNTPRQRIFMAAILLFMKSATPETRFIVTRPPSALPLHPPMMHLDRYLISSTPMI
ncbi:hypothetical protein JCM15548_12470 [Geofilum rubicundum JCM 15548]|uniref:DUF11 domain-containing protein n=1 Tax=Geofilum rubicundum JCM 15548 TaxID=1236989 RepID=A0A0E9LY34_9BACT|nr:hypothetical protein JCM15548_12470 [Geofilum rubicundum JCM 15548]